MYCELEFGPIFSNKIETEASFGETSIVLKKITFILSFPHVKCAHHRFFHSSVCICSFSWAVIIILGHVITTETKIQLATLLAHCYLLFLP